MATKVVTIVGARPQFIKASAVSRAIRHDPEKRVREVLVHTGQHYDENMSKVFFEELEIPQPDYNLSIAGGLHGEMTGRMLAAIEAVLLQERPDWVMVYGDTNSTLAGALAAAKLHIPVAHVEAGLRSFNMRMPEEVNRVLTDRVSKLLFCPTETAVKNLEAEGARDGVFNVGDVMYDVALFYGERARKKSDMMDRLGLSPSGYVLATCHRAENTDDPKRLREICIALAEIAQQIPVIFPIHPRTRKLIDRYQLAELLKHVNILDPLPFLDMIALEQNANLILTDSGGIQKEAFFFNVPCITMRDETEWVETVECGKNRLTGADSVKIKSAFQKALQFVQANEQIFPYGSGNAASYIKNHLKH